MYIKNLGGCFAIFVSLDFFTVWFALVNFSFAMEKDINFLSDFLIVLIVMTGSVKFQGKWKDRKVTNHFT